MAGDSQALLLEGFQVHLDLRLEPEATAPLPAGSLDGQRPDGAATERASPRRAPGGAQATPTYQQWAVLVALATLLLALASWWVGNEPAQPTTEHGDTTESLPVQLPEPAASSSSVAPAAPAVEAPVGPALAVPGGAAPPVAATLPASARPATMSSSTPRPPRALPSMRARTAKTSGAAQSAALAAEPGEAKPAAAHARASRLGSDDLLELFGDTK